MEGKVCSKCGVWKPIEGFSKRKASKDGRVSQCKECMSEYQKQRYSEKHPKETREGMKKCTKCGVWKSLDEFHKKKDGKHGRQSQCKECINKPPKETREGMKKCTKCKQWRPIEEYHKKKASKDGRRSECKECAREQRKQYYQNNKEHEKEQSKQYKESNKEHCKEQSKQWRENNKEYNKEQHKRWRENNKEKIKEYNKMLKEIQYYKEYFENNKESYHEYDKKSRGKRKENNLQYISSIVEQINPVFKQLNLPVYGYVYMFENIKTKHKYLGQSIQPISRRYAGGIVQGWIKERLEKDTQKFKEELIEEDIIVTETLDVAFCQYHLDKLEAYYIDKYDSYNNGYNNNAGHHNTDDGIEEFNRILLENNLQFIDGKLIRMKEVV